MMKYLFYFVGCVSLAVFLWACPASKTVVPTRSTFSLADYFPLRVGDRRIYRINFASTNKPVEREIKIVRKDGDVYFDDQTPNESYQLDPYGLRGRNRYLLKYPLQVGTRWLSVASLTSVERYVIVDVNREVRVPAGTFQSCVVVRSRDSRGRDGVLEAMFFFAPKVGMVKITTSLEQKGKKFPQWTLELVSYLPASS